MDTVSLLLLLLHALVQSSRALPSIFLSYHATKATRQTVELMNQQLAADVLTKRMDVHSRSKAKCETYKVGFPDKVNDPQWKPSTPQEKRVISLYWYLVFDEWFTCTQGPAELQSLWVDHYRHGVKSALRLPGFEGSIAELFKREATFLGKGREFREVINGICWEVHARDLRSMPAYNSILQEGEGKQRVEVAASKLDLLAEG